MGTRTSGAARQRRRRGARGGGRAEGYGVADRAKGRAGSTTSLIYVRFSGHLLDEVRSSYAVVAPPSGRFSHSCPQAPRIGELHEQDRRGARSDFRRRFWRESGDGRRRGRKREEAGFRRRDAGKRRISFGGACGTAAAPTICGTLPKFGHGRSQRGRASRERRGPVRGAGLAVALLPRARLFTPGRKKEEVGIEIM